MVVWKCFRNIFFKGKCEEPPNPCEVCGIYSYTKCGLFNALVHYFPHKGGQKSQILFAAFHSNNFFGLERIDVDLIGNKNMDWKTPTVSIKNHSKRKIRVMKDDDSEKLQ